jgi:hypothetical protein
MALTRKNRAKTNNTLNKNNILKGYNNDSFSIPYNLVKIKYKITMIAIIMV